MADLRTLALDSVSAAIVLSEVTIGREPGNVIVIDDPTVSAHHARIVRGGETGLRIEDGGSSNGTFVNGERVSASPLRFTDDVRVGSASLHLSDPRISGLLVRVNRRPPRGEPALLGSDPRCDVVVDYPGVDPQHAMVIETPQHGVLVRDLGGPGGTGLNHPGFTIHEGVATLADVLWLGHFPLPLALLARLMDEHGRVSMPLAQDLRAQVQALNVDNLVVTIGRTPGNDLVVPHPTVSSHHARLVRQTDGTVGVEDLGSTNGTYVNGQRVKRGLARQSDRVGVGAVVFVLGHAGAIADVGRARVRLDLAGVSYVVRDRATGNPRPLLDDISMAVYPSELVAMLGPSGAGKTTLLLTVLGLHAPTRGYVLLNGRPLFQQYEAFRTNLGYVPQDDIVHAQLTVREALRFACKLRLPAGTPRALREEAIDRTLQQVGLLEQRDLQIGSPEEKILSGGQRRRVNLAVELVTDPALLVLDEPTSGLSWRDAADVVATLRRLADEGRTVILTIHQPDFQEYEKFDSVAILGKGGRLLFIGPPAPTSYDFFGVPPHKPRDVFDRIEQMEPEQWRQRFRASEAHKRFVVDRSPDVDATATAVPPPRPRPRSSWRQLPVLLHRNLVLTWRARAALMILLLQAPLLGLLVGLTTRNSMSVPAPAFGCGSADSTVDWCAGVDDRIACEPQRRMAAIRSFGPPAYATVRISDPRTSLLAILLAIFLPIVIVAANALVGERTIYQRERLAGLNIVPYVVARYLVLLLLGAAVAGLHLAVAVPVLGLYGDFGWYFAVALLTASAAAAIGLVLSAAVRTQTAALWGINLLVVPQLLFAGAMAKLDGFRDVASYFTATRWGLEALAKYSLAFRPELQLCQVQRHAQTFAGFGSSLDGVMLRPILGLGAITLACLVAAMWLLKRRDITPG